MPVALAVMLGGALGALARYGLDSLIEHRAFSIFPWSTFVINVSGASLPGRWSPRLSIAITCLLPVSVVTGIAAVLAGTVVGRSL